MVSPIEYIRTYTGIDLELPLDRQSPAAVDAALARHAGVKAGKPLIPTQNEAIYDAVVGIDYVRQCGFDKTSAEPERLLPAELEKLSALAKGMRAKIYFSGRRSNALEEIQTAAGHYHEFLSGTRTVIKKDDRQLGSRHTLLQGEHGKLFEMTNSMTGEEVLRFKRKTSMEVSAVEKPKGQYLRDGELFHKIELGAGAFGKARIARNILSDEYVAVKKSYPRITLHEHYGFFVAPPTTSSVDFLRDTNNLDRLKDAAAVPMDECAQNGTQSARINGVARDLNALSLSYCDVKMWELSQTTPLKNFWVKNGDEGMRFALAKMLDRTLPPIKTDSKTIYSFSELGLASIENVIENLNVLRFYFEGSKDHEALPQGAKELLTRYIQAYGPESFTTPTAKRADEARPALDVKHFGSPSFNLKHPLYNQRFSNTLAAHMLSALSTLHTELEGKLSHGDIKPDNIVLIKKPDGNLSLKLIDLDFVKDQTQSEELPTVGCRAYLPPEACFPERDDSISYRPQKADSYAMGISLRLLAGFSFREISALSSMQKAVVGVEWMKEKYKSIKTENLNNEIHRLKARIRYEPLTDDNCVQNQSRIRSKMESLPQAVSLKDIADLMLKDHPGKRYSPAEVLALGFFKNPENFLCREEFSNHAEEILRFGNVIGQEELFDINDHTMSPTDHLKTVRQTATAAALHARGQVPVTHGSSTLSEGETKKLSQAELSRQVKAVMQRNLRSLSRIGDAKITIAEKKLQHLKC